VMFVTGFHLAACLDRPLTDDEIDVGRQKDIDDACRRYREVMHVE
jgi:hypothetical protein